MFASTTYGQPTGSVTTNHGVVVEFEYTPVSGLYAAFQTDVMRGALPAGSYGLAIYHNGISNSDTNGTATNTFYGNADVTLTRGHSLSGRFTGSPIASRVWSGTILYSTSNVAGRAGFGFFGEGCAGALGIPALTSNTRPVLGQDFTVDVNRLPTNAGMLAVGFSSTAWGLRALPYDLTGFGMPGCSARVSADVTFGLAGVNNTASFTTPIPARAPIPA